MLSFGLDAGIATLTAIAVLGTKTMVRMAIAIIEELFRLLPSASFLESRAIDQLSLNPLVAFCCRAAFERVNWRS